MEIAMTVRNRNATEIALIGVVVLGLAIDAFVHFDLAGAFAGNKTSTLSEADIFRADATVALIAAIALLVRPRRYTAAFAFLVAAAGTAAVIITRYVNVGKIGPIPNLYDPYWAPFEKSLSVIGEAAASLAALALLAILHRQARTEPARQAIASSPSVSSV
jgi:hypothetical protein